MVKALFVHGLNSDENSTTGKLVKKILAEFNIEVLTETFDLLNPHSSIEKIDNLVSDVDMIIGHSLGGFYVLFETTSIPKIVINPCMFPSIEIPRLTTISDDLIKKWEKMENFYLKYIDAEMSSCTFGIFAKNDELFSHIDAFKEFYGKTNAGMLHYDLIEGNHRLTKDELEMPLIKAVSYFEELSQYPNLKESVKQRS